MAAPLRFGRSVANAHQLRSDRVHERRGVDLARASFARDENTNAFDHLSGRARSLRQKGVGGAGAIECGDRAGDDHGGQAGLKVLCATNKLIAIHLRHDEITEQEVNRAESRLFDDLERVGRRERRDDAIAAGFKKEGAYGEHLFVVVYAKDRFLGPQRYLSSAGGSRPMGGARPVGWLVVDPKFRRTPASLQKHLLLQRRTARLIPGGQAAESKLHRLPS